MKTEKKSGGPKGLRMVAALVGVVIIGFGSWMLLRKPSHKPPDPNIPPKYVDAEPRFVKEGELVFLHPETRLEKKRFDIEIADSDQTRMQGLMFRKRMEEAHAMLFIFPQAELQSFWMKNTHISLDIIYVNEKKEVVSIQKNTIPFSEQGLPSYYPAQFVVEVNAGLADAYGIREGDLVAW